MSQRLAGKVAVITGGSSGIGLATAKRFVDEGAYVFITGRRKSELDAAVKEIGRNVRGVQSDVSKLADIDALYAVVKEQKGKLDIVFANAGTGEFAPLGQITEEHFDKQFDLNVKGLLFTVQKALPLLQSGGAIVLNASIVATKGNQMGWEAVSGRDAVRSQVIDVLEAQIKRRPAMKKISTVSSAAEQECFSTKADDRIGPGRSHELVLRAG